MGKLHINLLGTSFTIQADEDTEYLEKLLGYYKRITDDICSMGALKNPVQVSILSGIMLCDELYKEKENKINSQITSQKITSSSISIAKEDAEKAEKITLEMIKRIDDVL